MRRNVYSSLGAQWISAALGIVSSVLVARMMQPTELGTFTVTTSLLAILSTLQMAGASEYLLYSKSLDIGTRRSVYGMTVILTALICVGLVIGRPLLIYFFGSSGVADVAAVMAISVALGTCAAPVNAMLSRTQRFDLLSIATVAQSFTLSILQIVFVRIGLSYMGLAYAAIAAGLVNTAALFLLGRKHILIRPSFRGLAPLFRTTSKLFTANALNMVNANAPSMVIGSGLGLGQAALFGRANMIAQIYAQTISRAVDPLLNARIAEDVRNGASATATLVTSSRLLFTISTSMFGFVALAAPLLVPLIFGAQWTAAAPVMRALALGMIIWPVAAPLTATILAAGRPGVLVRLRAINLAIRLTLLFLLVHVNLEAAAWGLSIANVFNLAQCLFAAHVYAGVKVQDFLPRLSGSLVAALIPLGVTAAAMLGLAAIGWTGWPLLISISAVMAIAQLIALIAFRHPLWLEVLELWNRRRAAHRYPATEIG